MPPPKKKVCIQQFTPLLKGYNMQAVSNPLGLYTAPTHPPPQWKTPTDTQRPNQQPLRYVQSCPPPPVLKEQLLATYLPPPLPTSQDNPRGIVNVRDASDDITATKRDACFKVAGDGIGGAVVPFPSRPWVLHMCGCVFHQHYRGR